MSVRINLMCAVLVSYLECAKLVHINFLLGSLKRLIRSTQAQEHKDQRSMP